MKRTVLTVAVLALAGVALYAIAGFWIAPRILERELRAAVAEGAQMQLAVETVAVNPFTLTLSLDNVTLVGAEIPPSVSVNRLEGRIRGIDFHDKSVLLRDVVLHSLEARDGRGRTFLTVPSAAALSLVLGRSPAGVSIEAPQIEGPRLSLRRERDGSFGSPDALFLLRLSPEVGRDEVRLAVTGGSLVFTDDSPLTPVQLDVADIDGSVRWQATEGDVVATASLHGRSGNSGTSDLSAEWQPARPREKSRARIGLHHFDLSPISPYLVGLLDRSLLAGRMDLDTDLSIEESTLSLDTDIVAEDLRFDAPSPGVAGSDDAGRGLPVETAMALLEDDAGRITIDVPVISRPLADGTGVAALFSTAVADYLRSLTAAPFRYLADCLERPDMDLARLPFPPGSAEIRPDAAASITLLNRALEARPLLALKVFPGLDEDADRAALARKEILLHVNLATSAGLPGEPAPQSLDFDDPIVRDVLDEFAADRLPPARRAALAQRNPQRDLSYYRAVFDALVDNEDVSLPALVRLARYRAQAVAEKLAVAKTDRDRVRLAEEIVLSPPGNAGRPEVTLEIAGRERELHD